MSEIRPEDLRIDTYTNSSSLTEMRLTHCPTGTSVDGVGVSSSHLRVTLMKALRQKLDGRKKGER